MLKYLFAISGFAMLLAAFAIYSDTQDDLKGFTFTDARVIDVVVDTRYSDHSTTKPIVEFNAADGTLIQFTTSSSSYPPIYKKGGVVQVLYPRNSPKDARINDFFSLWYAPLFLLVLGLLFFSIGFSIIAVIKLKARKVDWLKKSGVPIKAKVIEVKYRSSLTINGRSPFVIYAEWLDPKTYITHIFKSNFLWSDPTDFLGSDKITVLIDRNNPKKYFADTAFLPQE